MIEFQSPVGSRQSAQSVASRQSAVGTISRQSPVASRLNQSSDEKSCRGSFFYIVLSALFLKQFLNRIREEEHNQPEQ